MDYPNKKDISFIDIYDDEVATYPRAVTYTGTVSTDSQDSKVLIADSDGDGFTTNFVEFGNNVAGFEEIRKGYYLFDGTEIRKVVGVTPSAQAITLDSPFTTSYEGLKLKVIKPILLPRVTFQNTGAVDGSIYTKTSPTDQTQYGSITLKAGDGYTFDSSTLSAFVIDSTNTTVKLSNAFFFEVGASGGGGTSYVPPYLKTGGASWSGTGLVYDVSGLEYYFNGDKLAAATQVTLDASDPIDNRLDAIVVDEAGVVSVIKGDASASPISPSVDELHILIQYILVEAGSTQPTIAKEDIYLENAEWTTSTYTTGAATGSIDFNNAVSPKQGVKCISANADARLGARFVRATSFDPYQYTMLSMWVRFTGSNVATNKSLNVRFENGAGALVANTINLFNFGLQRNLLNVWQLVVIPITSFGALPTSVKGLKIIMAGGTVGQPRQWDIDLISLTDNSVPSINEQAFNILKDGALVGQSSTINFKGAPVTVTNDPINKKIDVEVIGGSGSALSSITAATATNTINNVANTQEWQWNSLSASTGLKLSSSSTANTSGSVLLDLTMTGTTATQQNNTVLRIANNKTNTNPANKGIDMNVTGGIGINMAVGATGTGINLAGGMSSGIQMNDNTLYFSSTKTQYISHTTGDINFEAGTKQLYFKNTGTTGRWAWFGNTMSYNNYTSLNRHTSNGTMLIFGGEWDGTTTISNTATPSLIKASSGGLTFSSNSGASTTWGSFTPNNQMTIYNVNNNVGIGTTTPVASAILDLTSTTKGFAPPEMTATQASAISTTSRKLIIYVTDTNGTFTSAGLWMWNGTTWKLILAE